MIPVLDMPIERTTKALVRSWEAPCDALPLWFVPQVREQSSSWFVKPPKIEVVSFALKRKEVLTLSQASARAIAILKKAEAERDQIAEEEARIGPSF